MTPRLPFYDTPPYQRHSATSRAAAAEAHPAADTQRGRILSYLRGAGGVGATDEQIQEHLNLNPSTERPRRIELVQQGYVVDSGRTARTRSGRRAVVWVAK